MKRLGILFVYCALLLIPVIVVSGAIFISLIKVGDKAPDFNVTSINGENISLDQYKGKVVIIHLWSHTCPHCREMNPSLAPMLAPYKNANLAYIMIDIDTDTTNWRKVIKEDRLSFAIHATDPHDGAAKTMVDYDGSGTPCINIADENGNLAGVNVTTLQLNKYLKKKF